MAGETRWIRSLRRGDSAAGRQLVDELFPPLVRFLVGMGFSREDAEDAAVETLVQVIRTIHQVRNDNAVMNWAMTIAYRLARKEVPVTDCVEDRPAVNSDPLWVEFHLARLSADHREAICLAEFGGFNVAEIAGLTGVPEGTVKSRLYHARQKLQSQIQEEKEELYVED